VLLVGSAPFVLVDRHCNLCVGFMLAATAPCVGFVLLAGTAPFVLDLCC